MNRSLFSAIMLALVVSACGGDKSSPTSPSPSPTQPTAATAIVNGMVTSAAGGPLAGATVTALDGANAGRSTTTDANGAYQLSLQAVNTNFAATYPAFGEVRRGLILQAGTNSLSFSLTPTALFNKAGQGNTVFDKPAYVTRLRITGRLASGSSSNFILYCGSSLVVNELLGQAFGNNGTYEGIHSTPNCTQIEIRNSSNVAWTMTEVR